MKDIHRVLVDRKLCSLFGVVCAAVNAVKYTPNPPGELNFIT